METVLLFILGVLVVVIGLAVSIALHEVGHLLPAKKFGVKVTQYMIGFGPTLFSKKRGETEYGVKAIPLGGFISMIGMFPPIKSGGKVRNASTGFFNTMVQDARDVSAEGVGDDEHRAFYRLPTYKRIIIMLGGPAMNLLIALVLYAVLLMGFGTAQVSTTVGSVSACVVSATSTSQTCGATDAPAPGAAAGIMPGDRLVSIQGNPVTSWAQSTDIIRNSAGVPLSFIVLRNGVETPLTITPLLSERYAVTDSGQIAKDANGQDITQNVGFVGIGAAQELVPQPVTSVLPIVGENIGGVVHIIANLPARLVDVANAAFGSGPRDPNGPISVVGIGRVAGEITSIDMPVQSKVASLLGLLASLNVALFVINLVPLMPLDGGHVAGALWDALRRGFARLLRRPTPEPFDTAKLMPLTFGVVILLGGMSALLIYADIVKPISLFG